MMTKISLESGPTIENGLILLAFVFSQLIVNLDQPNVTEGTCSVRVLIS